MSAAGVVVIVDDQAGVGQTLASLLTTRGLRTVRLIPDSQDADADTVADAGGGHLAGDLSHPEGVCRLVERLHARHGAAVALVHLAALAPGAEEVGWHPERWRARIARDVDSLFLLSKALGPDLERAAGDGGAAVMGVTALGGTFAVDGLVPPSFAGHGGIAGLIKTLAQEWPTVRAKAVDLGLADPEAIAAAVADELLVDDGLVEVGYRGGQRTALQVAPSPLRRGEAGALLASDSVVLITGGARGITAEVAIRLAETGRPRLLLVGRTAPPVGPEPPDTAGRTDPRTLRQALLDRQRRDDLPIAPAVVEEAYRRLLREREVRTNLERLRRTGAVVDYLTCDVSDADALTALIERVYRDEGRIDGVIHGAGIIEDKLIRDKHLDSFRRVLGTKVNGAVALARTLRPESLRFLVFFSSITARFGNRGQADYAAANEVLNKLAQRLDQQWPGRVISIGWGPWLTAGMVSPEVRRQFAARGVALVTIEEGCRRLEEELRSGRKGDVEVLVAGFGPPALAPGGPKPATARGPEVREVGPAHPPALPLMASATLARDREAVNVVRTFDPHHDRYLLDHRMDGRPVLPFAMAMELMAEVAAAGWPGYEVVGLREIRLLRGVVFDGAAALRVTARPVSGQPAAAEAPLAGTTLEVVIAGCDAPGYVHYRARVELRRGTAGGRDAEAAAKPAGPATLVDAGPLAMTLEETYRAWLFHGSIFQGIASLEAVGPGGTRAFLRPSSPRACLDPDAPGAWLLDPVVLDSALQVQLIWARRHWDVTLLPTVFQGYRRFAPIGGDGGRVPDGSAPAGAAAGGDDDRLIRHEMRMGPENRDPICHADHWFFDREGRLLFVLRGVETAGSQALNRLAEGVRQ